MEEAESTEQDSLLLKPLGLLSLLDEESIFPNGTDLTFANKLKLHLNFNSCFGGDRGKAFTVCHYAGEVMYDTAGFLEKINRDLLHLDSIQLLSSCSCHLPQKFASSLLAQSEKSVVSPSYKAGVAYSQKLSVATKFKEYIQDGVDWTKVNFEDNQDCLNLFEKKPLGLLSLLDEESTFPNGTDLTFANKLKQHLNFNSCFRGDRGKAFTVCHYAAEVMYDMTGFLEKIRDLLHLDSIQLLSSCSCHLPHKFASCLLTQSEKSVVGPSYKAGGADSQKLSVATKFKDALQQKYLKALLSCVFVTKEGPVIDEYAFAFCYSNSDSQEVSMNINCTGTKKQGGTFSYNSAEEITSHHMRSSACKNEPHMSHAMSNFDCKHKNYMALIQLGNGALFGASYIQVYMVLPHIDLFLEDMFPPSLPLPDMVSLRVEVHDVMANLIFMDVFGRVDLHWQFNEMLLFCWSRRHELSPLCAEAFTRRARRRNPPIWPHLALIAFEYNGQWHEDLPDPLSLLVRVHIVEDGVVFRKDPYGRKSWSLSRFISFFNNLLDVPLDGDICDGLKFQDTEPRTMISAFSFKGRSVFRGFYVPPLESERKFLYKIFKAWMIRHFVDDQYWMWLFKALDLSSPPIIWPDSDHIWYLYEGEIHIEPHLDWLRVEEVIIYEYQSIDRLRLGIELDCPARFGSFLRSALGENFFAPLMEIVEYYGQEDFYYGNVDVYSSLLLFGDVAD